MLLRVFALTLVLSLAGCYGTGPLLDPAPWSDVQNPPPLDQNPIFFPYGRDYYGPLFETVLQVLGDYQFEIAEANRYDGRIEAVPRISPGIALALKPGSPACRERLLSTFQTYRHRVSVTISPAEHDGYFVEVVCRRELEDLPRPIKATVGSAVFRSELNTDRMFDVVDATFFEPNWIYRGRDVALEREIIRRLRRAF